MHDRERSQSGEDATTGLWRGGFELDEACKLPHEGNVIDNFIQCVDPGRMFLFYGCRDENDWIFKVRKIYCYVEMMIYNIILEFYWMCIRKQCFSLKMTVHCFRWTLLSHASPLKKSMYHISEFLQHYFFIIPPPPVLLMLILTSFMTGCLPREVNWLILY